MRRRDIAEEMVSIKGREWRVTLRVPRVSVRTTGSGRVSGNHYPVLLQHLKAQNIQIDGRMCAQCIRHPINGSIFTLVLSAFFFFFFGVWVGGVEVMTGNLLVLVKSQVYERLHYFSALWRGTLCISLSCQCEQSGYFHSGITVITFPQRTL